MDRPELSEAIADGDLDRVRGLLDAGADVRYVRPRGYTALIDVMCGRTLAADVHLIPLIQLLVDRGADLNAVSDYGESALSVASRHGRFDAVWALLTAKADPDPLEWTALHLAVALRSEAMTREQIAAGHDLAAADRWGRTPWLIAVQNGDIPLAELLLAAGADGTVRGRCGQPRLMYPVQTGDLAMLRWLLDRGADPNETDDFGNAPLLVAAGNGDAEGVRLLLDAGADVHHRHCTLAAIGMASTVPVMRLLVAAGADPAEMSGTVRAVLTGQPKDGRIDCTPADYQAGKRRRFGTANPERMDVPFWRAMVAGGATAHQARQRFEPDADADEPVWCFERFGTSLTELPDGRVIEVGGEHEDAYDADFCIYNDVVVHHGDGTFDLYGYPEEVFPPTDFHSATLVGRFIYLIGSAGYYRDRRYGTTQVYRLDIDSLAVEPVETAGDPPGWINRHRATLVGDRIEVSGGKVCFWADGEERYEDNPGRHVLDLATGTWSRLVEGSP